MSLHSREVSQCVLSEFEQNSANQSQTYLGQYLKIRRFANLWIFQTVGKVFASEEKKKHSEF